ncbi:MAG: hypothetical protein MOP51_2516 [Citricoccus sp.]|jgi:hypothetical protein|nr:hypothetical protein [Citricoccus sp. WCRC_4]
MTSPMAPQHQDDVQPADATQADNLGELIEEVSIDGMCGVY